VPEKGLGMLLNMSLHLPDAFASCVSANRGLAVHRSRSPSKNGDRNGCKNGCFHFIMR